MPTAKTEFGMVGEERACQWARERGWDILGRNYRTRRGEVDVIAKDGACYVFLEVKTRRSRTFGGGAEAVDFRKRQRVTTAAAQWLAQNRLLEAPIRFDVLAWQVEGSAWQAEWIPNAWGT